MIGKGSFQIWFVSRVLRPRVADRLLGKALGLRPAKG